MEIRDRKLDDQTALVVLRGTLDASTVAAVQDRFDQILAGGVCFLVADIAGIDYISSAGLRVLLMAGKRLAGIRGKLVVHSASARVQEVFDLSGFSSLFPLCGSREEAVALVQR